MIDVPPWRFDRLVRDALDGLPPDIAAFLDNVAVQIRDEDPDEPDLLGLYVGTPLTEWGGDSGMLPAVIFVYRLPLLEMCESEEDLAEEVRVTVVHELAHHAGIDDDRLAELGWD